MIGLIAATAAGRRGCERLAAAWPDRTRVYDAPVAPALERAFAECDQLVCFLATGAVVRLVAPLLRGKDSDPGIVTVDEAHQHAVALLGGHGGGANALARAVCDVLGAAPVITTATDAVGTPGLDTLGFPAEGALAVVGRAILDGERVALRTDAVWPLPALPANVSAEAGPARLAVPAGRDTAGTTDSAMAKTGSAPPDSAVPRLGVAADSGAAGRGDRQVGPGAGSAPLAAEESAGGPQGGGDAGDARFTLWVTDRVVPLDARTAVLRPPSLVVGVGGSRGVSADEVLALIRQSLADAGLAAGSVAVLATVDAKADEAGIVEAAERLGVPLATYGAAELAAIEVPNPSAAPLAAVGTPSVAEAAALAASASGGGLLVPKRKSAMATAAVARRGPRGRLAVVGLGPGARDLLTPRAREELRRASVIVGLDQYVDQIRDLLRPGTRVLESGLGAEEERARTAVAEAQEGHAVALIGSGDAGVYAMASPALAEAGTDIDVVGVPGVTAALAAAAVLGAPLGHDHVSISLSDLHTPWGVIERRVRAAAEADLVVTFYNPRSRGRDWQLPKALGILGEHRAPTTPVGIVHAASRPDERSAVTTLAALDVRAVDMVTVVTVGNTATREVAGRMVTPRGYRWQAQPQGTQNTAATENTKENDQ
ncbi:precorrin-3B C(17)-methyltransferase [Actinacidiphila oryziradicis]|uniref:precorrin-3B C(17)-methyltransferase n=1 Tax=Actinacidiphila oryziradicis TaxID=2571141 RepID=UPI0023F20C7C|nr:precorrin-3B C(17)-methyltransferase [Actinacidiphila oryziradicis]MCW2874056.1 Precorrin methylase [Actinacidiphila oryziradicis]